MIKLGKIFFKYRSYTPLPFIVLMILSMKPTLISIIAGLFVVIIGELIRLWAVSYAGSETRTTDGVGGTYLVTQGPFSYLRNPLYFGNVIIYTGLGIMSFAEFQVLPFPGIQILTLLFFTFQYFCIILNEEEYLVKAFEEKFLLYKNTINRFIPIKHKLPEEIKSDLNCDLRNGIKSEKRSLQSISIILLVILIFYFYKLFNNMF